MKFTILGSGGCVPIPKPLCQCEICKEARNRGVPYSRLGSAAFLHDINMLIDSPPQIFSLLNLANIKDIDNVLYTHLDSDHLDGHSAFISCYFDGLTYVDHPCKTMRLLVPTEIDKRLPRISSQYGSMFDYYFGHNVLEKQLINGNCVIDNIEIVPIFVNENPASAYIYLFVDRQGKKILYAPCDMKPFPFKSKHVYDVDIFIVQPGYFEDGLRGGFKFPSDDYTRIELYSFDETMEISRKIRAKKTIFTHLEEYWNRSYTDYQKLGQSYNNIEFAYDGMEIEL